MRSERLLKSSVFSVSSVHKHSSDSYSKEKFRETSVSVRVR